MDRKLKLKVGQKVVIKIIEGSNAARYLNMSLDNIDEWCFDGEVTKVGRKYITVKFDWREEKFSIEDDYRQNYDCGGADYKLYLNREEVMNEINAEKIYSELKKHFGGWGGNNNKFTLDQLQRIKEIVDENDGLD